MIARVLHIARREVKEILRQPGLVAVVLVLVVGIALFGGATLYLLDQVTSGSDFLANLELFGPALGFEELTRFADFVRVVLHGVNFLVFTQFLGVSAVLAGHTVIHERETKALPFLLLAPVRRGEIIVGKVLGAVFFPGVVYGSVVVALGLFLRTLALLEPCRDLLPPSGGWLAGFCLAGPIWALVVCTACAIASTIAPDVRTAQQLVWLVVTAATLTVGYALTALVGQGAGPELVLAVLGAALLAILVLVGSATLSRDLAR